MVVTQHIILDTLRLNTTDIVQGKQGDTNSRALNATITQNGRSLEIPEDAVAIFSVERSDGQSQSFACEIKGDHSVQISLPEWVLEIPGRCSCSISISSGTETVSTLSFILNVQPAEWSRNWIIVHVSSMNELAPGTYYIEVGERGYTFVTTAFVPLNGAVAFNRNFTEAATFGNILLSNHECIETGIVITSGKNGTRLDRNGKTVMGSVIEEMERVWGIVHEALVEQTLLADRVEQEEHDMLAAEVLRAGRERALCLSRFVLHPESRWPIHTAPHIRQCDFRTPNNFDLTKLNGSCYHMLPLPLRSSQEGNGTYGPPLRPYRWPRERSCRCG